MWWRQHRTCPVCKKRLKFSDFHHITYRPQDLVVQEEKTPTKIEPERSLENSIYTDISTGTLREIKNIEIDGFHGTKIDTLIRHILWLRVHDPGSKSVLFSQYKGFLDVLGTACSRYKIGYSSIDSKNGIEDFKSDPAVCFPVCFLPFYSKSILIAFCRSNASFYMLEHTHQVSIWSTRPMFSSANHSSTPPSSYKPSLVSTVLASIAQPLFGCIWSLVRWRSRSMTSPFLAV